MYRLCEQMKITLISVGHKEGLKNFHDYLLQLDEEHNWTFKKLNKESLVESNKII